MKPFSYEKTENYELVKLGKSLTYAENREFDVEVDSLANYASKNFLIDCTEVEVLSKEWIRSLLRLQLELKKKQFQMRLVAVPLIINIQLKKEGVDTAFTISGSIREAMSEMLAPCKKSFDTAFINPFLEGTINVLEVQANIKAQPGKVCLKKGDNDFPADISGIIGIVSESFNGSVIISFPEATFLKVMSGMLGEEFTEINKDILDGAGEITNMIFGHAKIILNEKGYGIKTALPSVVHGKNHVLSTKTKGPIVVIPFESMAGNFHVEICLSA